MSFHMMGGVQGWNLTDVTIMLEVGSDDDYYFSFSKIMMVFRVPSASQTTWRIGLGGSLGSLGRAVFFTAGWMMMVMVMIVMVVVIT